MIIKITHNKNILEEIVEQSAVDATLNGQKNHKEFFDVPEHFDNGEPSVSDGISEFIDSNEQFADNNEEMNKNKKGKAIVEMVMSPKFSKIVGQKEKHIKSQAQEEDEQKDENEAHAFCRECLKGYTKAALETKPFARGWIGLKCMAEKCENTIPWQKIKKDASRDELEAIKTLENHCAEMSVLAAGLYLERCPKCNCAVEMDCPLSADCDNDDTNNDISDWIKGNFYCLLKLLIFILRAICPVRLNELFVLNEILKFHCPECNYEMCRKCNEKWAEEHNHLTCEQFAKQQNREGYLRDKQLSEKFVNGFTKCPKCKSPVEKIDGCNHMHCRCGASFNYRWWLL
ncbi:hypothetical protein niasHT_015153 [Heterodera trifolii]|uniref:RING-type domain-containing protein n=1 Tax=Heterodera trifolii TaxID=157864 RepID=A0ABD2LB91_9BILA